MSRAKVKVEPKRDSNAYLCNKDWDPGDVTPEEYVKFKVKILKRDMCVTPTSEEMKKLYSLTDRSDIDRAVRAILDSRWG